MKKIISIFLVLCMAMTLLPTAALASEETGDAEGTIVAEFLGDKTAASKSTNGKYTMSENTVWTGFTLVSDASTTLKMQNNGDYAMLQVYYSSSGFKETYYWPSVKNNNLQFTIIMKAPTAGYYSTDFDFTAHNYSGGYTMYVNGVAAGEINGYKQGYIGAEDSSAKLNTVYLNEGDNTVSFRLTKLYKRTQKDDTEAAGYDATYFYPKKLTFTPVDAAPIPNGFTSTLPAEITKDEAVDFTVNPVMSDGTEMYFGKYDDNGDVITDLPITLTALNGEITNLTRTTEGVSGTFTATETGTATITATTSINGKEYSDSFDVTIASDEEVSDEEIKLPETITMSVTGSANSVTVNGTTQTSDTKTYSANVGDSVTVVANDIAGKIFRGWLRGGENGTVVWLDKEYTFTAATNVALYAKYTDAPAESAEVKEYYDWNGEFLAYEAPESSTLSKYGFKFSEWLSNTVENITRYVADYKADNTYTITKPDGVTASIDNLTSVPHETEITLTNGTPVSWYVNNKLAAYGTSYTFLATEKADITIADELQESPIVKLDNVEGNTYILEYNANGKTVIEKGIIIGGDNTSITSCYNKVISQRNVDSGKLMAKNDTDYTIVRGYIIYEDGDTYRVVYADIE